MVFSSPIFLFLFLPVVLFGSLAAGPRLRNAFLLVASLVFYAWGEPVYVLLMVFSIFFNFVVGQRLGPGAANRAARSWLNIGIAGNLLLLGHFKYTNFLVENLNQALSWLQLPQVMHEPVTLPIGISFFTFHALSYLIDVHRRKVTAESSLVNLGLYVAMFPQLVAGPIVRYVDIAAQIRERTVTLELFSDGVGRFLVGLAKKMLLANPCGEIADAAFAEPAGSLALSMAWLGVVTYAFQIYFDFSGYSDMAIGLGKMFGFRYLENFNYPYISRSIREFWRRWHISLSTWFRDYLYIPLGGNRSGAARSCFNLILVFTLCGLWHGASWNFLFWGWIHGAFLALERTPAGRLLDRAPALLARFYTLFVVLVAWVFFRAETLPAALAYLAAMFNLGESGTAHSPLVDQYAGSYYAGLFVIAAVASTPAGSNLATGLLTRAAAANRQGPYLVLSACRLLYLGLIVFLALGYVASDTYNPFIYFRF